LNHAANSSWLRSRRLTASSATSQLPIGSIAQYSRSLNRTLVDTLTLPPSWIYLAMIVIATAAICLTANFRGHAQLNAAQTQFRQMETDIETLRRSNKSLHSEIFRITTEPSTIESAARARLGMVRPTDVVVPLQSRSANLASISFVR
jgi:cell division protein FtsB